MLLNNVTPLSYYRIKNSKTASANAFPGRSLVCSPSCSLNVKTPLSSLASPNYENVEDSIERIREAFGKKVHELSASSYDTAWVAMVPSLETPNKPYFPQCLDWIMEHQQKDGSWGPNPIHPSLVKDSLSCTLACLLALRKWAVGEDLVQRGLEFIGSNLWAANNKDQFSPIGFDISFPSMINYAKNFELVLPLDPAMYLNKDMEIQRRNGNLAYIAEGLGESHNWEEVLLAQQRSNGSLFNSPATTAAALIHCHNEKCLEYLHSILQTYKGWVVPTVYPSTIYTRLCMIDTLERLGVGRYFKQEIERVLDETYRCWQQKDEEIFTDVTCFALAFRLLRVNGYEVTSDDFEAYSDQENFFNTVSLQFTGVTTVLELFRASQFKLYKKEGILDQIHAWTSMFLKQQLLNQTILDKRLHEQVIFTLKNFHGTLDRLGYRRNIDLYDINEFQILKTSYRCPSIDNKDFIVLTQHDFNVHNAVHQKELQELERWYKNNRLDCLKFGRRVLQTAYFLIASLLSGPELSEARISYAQCVILVTLIDDFFDDYGSREELLNILELVKKWDEQPTESYSCEEVEILFTALFSTVNEMAAKGAIKQGRRIKHVLLKQWLDLIEGFMKEWEWWNEKITPTMDEYLSFTHTTIGCKVSIITAIHFLGPKFSEDMISSEECTSLCWHVSLICRLLNDIQTYKKESAENSPNIVSMQVAQNQGSIAKDEIVAKIQDMAEESRRKLLQIVFRKQGSLVPKECKNLFWGTGKIGHYLYCQGGDEFTSPDEMIKDMKAVIYEQLNLLNSAA
ncbi:Ent-kaur-16-ene synthase [Forsythia ovata]|uniref:Ent-kaur-16-ene synthase n=1 Tax=Forsythia ovata TaxID=205694 RepID=A0ABD1RNB7_9LAMI